MGRAYEVRKASIQKTGAAKGKQYSNFAKELYIAAKGNPDVESNEKLRRLVEKAKKEQIPSDIIKRAIDKAKGSGGEDYHEVIYEGFGPGASTFLVKCLTDNVNRTVGFVRGAFTKVGKSLGVTNSVAYNYDYLAIISFKYSDEDLVLETLLNNNLDIIDLESEGDEITITSNPTIINDVKNELEKLITDLEYTYDEIGMFAKEEISLDGEDKEVFDKLYSLLDEIDDVTNIYHNVDL